MLAIKIGKKIKIRKYCTNGIKFDIPIKHKIICIKFDGNETELLYTAIKLFNNKKEK